MGGSIRIRLIKLLGFRLVIKYKLEVTNKATYILSRRPLRRELHNAHLNKGFGLGLGVGSVSKIDMVMFSSSLEI